MSPDKQSFLLGFLLPLVVSGIFLPLAAWLARGLYDAWRLRGVYLTTVPATGAAVAVTLRDDGAADSLSVGTSLRVLNATDRPVALESAQVKGLSVRSRSLPSLRLLWDPTPLVHQLQSAYGEPDETTLLPVFVPPNGGVVYLRVQARLGFYRRRFFAGRSRFWPTLGSTPRAVDTWFWDNVSFGEIRVVFRISGKLRSATMQLA